MSSGIVEQCRVHFASGKHTANEIVAALRAEGAEFSEPSVRAIVSEMRKKASLTSCGRGRPRGISEEIERVFNAGQGLTTVAEILLHLKGNEIRHSPKTVRTLVQALRKQYNVSGDTADAITESNSAIGQASN